MKKSGNRPKGRPVGMSVRYEIFRRAVIWIGWLLWGFTVYGRERVPTEGPLIVASNHAQYLDPVYVGMAVPRRMRWMAKKELFVFPFRGVLDLLGSFPVDREGGGRSGLRAALDLLSEGWALGIFPEGTHRQDKKEREGVKSGAVMLAVRSGAEVLPIHVGDAPGPLGRLRGKRLRVHIGEPVRLDEGLRGGRAYRAAADGLLDTIYALPGTRQEGGRG